jgi:histidinol-phosphate aminotransferase
MNININSRVFKITPYQPGKPIEEVKREYNLKQVIKLASNENPFPPSDRVLSAMQDSLKNINRYPDGDCFYLKKKLAKKLGVDTKELVLGNGSDEILDMIAKAFLSPRENEIITADVTFAEYKITGQISGVKVKEVPLRNFKYDLKAIKAAITKKTKAIFIANPNNPTGTYIKRVEFEDFLVSIPENVIVVYDEAYQEFVDKEDFPCGLKYYKEKNFITLKTFSKIYGLAGLRVGYAVTSEEFAEAMNRVRQPFNVNSIAQAAALAALDDKGYVKRTREAVWSGKKFLERELDKLNIEYVPSVTNFILVNVKKDIFEPMLKLGVIVRPMDMYGLGNIIRVTVGTQEENIKFINTLKRALK